MQALAGSRDGMHAYRIVEYEARKLAHQWLLFVVGQLSTYIASATLPLPQLKSKDSVDCSWAPSMN